VREPTIIDRYLADVDSYLHVDRAQRRRVLAEIEGHLQDAVDARVAEGIQRDDAMRQAIAAMGPAQDVAMQLTPSPAPARSLRGWRRWTPIVVPTVVLAAGVALTVWNLVYLSRHGLTRGGQVALRYSVLYTAVIAALTAATYVAIRNGDRDPAWRRAAWGSAALTGVVVAMSYAV
jgi:hypothetical protein